MQQHADVVTDLKGNVIKGASVRVLLLDGTLATIWAANGGAPTLNPIQSGQKGEFAFFAPNGDYLLEISAGGKVLGTQGPVKLYDVLDDGDAARLSSLAQDDGATKVGFGQRNVGDKLADLPSMKDQGVSDAAADNLPAFVAAASGDIAHFDLPPGTYASQSFPSKAGATYQGRGAPTISFFDAADPVKVAFQSDSRYEGIKFSSSVADLRWQRTAIEDVDNVTLRDCGFFGFRHAVVSPDAWGLLIQRATNITLDACYFGNNSQSDIALTDEVRDVAIINPRNSMDGGVLLNVEPNGADGVVGMSVMGGHLRKLTLLENNYTAYASRALTFSGTCIENLVYDGSGASFAGCEIGAITNAPDGNGDVYAGALMIDNLSLGMNLIADERFMDVGANDASSYWAVYATGGGPWTQAIKDADGRYVRTNPGKASQQVALIERNFHSVTPGEVLILFNRARVDNTSISGKSNRNIAALWHDAGGTRIGQTGVINCRAPVATLTPWCDDVAVLIVPAGATQLKLQFGAGDTNGVSTDQSAAGLFRFKLKSTTGNMRTVIGALAGPANTDAFRRASPPSGANNYAGYFVGDRVLNAAPAVGQPKAWICTAAGTGGASGTWTSEGNL